MKKIVIIDDVKWVVGRMVKVAVEEGYEVLGICIVRPDFNFQYAREGQLTIGDFSEAAEAVRKFDPSLIFIDHDLNWGEEMTGEYLARMINLPAERFIGTSSRPQPYCAQRLMADKKNIGDEEYPEHKEDFLFMIK